MKLAIALLVSFFILLNVGRLVKDSAFKYGFDAGRADVLRSMHNCISSNDSQWVYRGRFYNIGNPENMQIATYSTEAEYTNRFFTNWTLRVKQPWREVRGIRYYDVER